LPRSAVPALDARPPVPPGGYPATTADVASALGVTIDYVRKLVRRGLLPAHYIGDLVRFNIGDVLAHVADGKAKPTQGRRRPCTPAQSDESRRGPKRAVSLCPVMKMRAS
jgi:excisionase family DNA binding protein